MRILVTGAGGFIGGHLVRRLLVDGHTVKAVDIKPFPEWWQKHRRADNKCIDLRDSSGAYIAFMHDHGEGFDRVYHLAANMGGMGHITANDAEIIRDNTLININMIEAARKAKVGAFLFSSSACVYPMYLQTGTKILRRNTDKNKCGSSRLGEPFPLSEGDAYPADPQHSYGWEKLHMEHLCKYYQEAGWLETRVARFHNCYGPWGSWNDGKEKAPAALCRKVALQKLSMEYPCECNRERFYGLIDIWGDGTAIRSFMHVDDCVEGLIRLMESDYHDPLNIGRDRAVTISELADIIIDIAGMSRQIGHRYIDGPIGVQWRNSDNSLCNEVLEWEPSIPIEEGLIDTFEWIMDAVQNRSCQGNCQCQKE